MSMVSGLSLQLHLLSIEHPQKHDAKHCSVCQQLLLAPSKFTQEPQSGLSDTDQLKGEVVFPLHVHITTFDHNPFSPRSPPSV